MARCQSFPIRSWVDLPHHVCNPSTCMPLRFQDCQNCFCLPLTLSASRLLVFLTPGTFHPKRWSLSSPRCPASKHFTFYSDPLNLALTGKSEICLHQIALSFPLSTTFVSKALPNIS